MVTAFEVCCSSAGRSVPWCFSHSSTVVQVIVITGDNKLTAEAICRKVGVFAVDEHLAGKSITGVEFMKLPLDKRRSMLDGKGGACFSRAEPKHKQVLLQSLVGCCCWGFWLFGPGFRTSQTFRYASLMLCCSPFCCLRGRVLS